jgi:NitT/TauT family transport system ATP-binding protein
MSSDPGRIRSEVRINLPRPRDVDSPRVRALVDQVYGLMTMRPVPQPVAVGAPVPAHPDYRLPDTDIDRIEAVLDLIAEPPFDGRADLPKLAEEAELPDEELFPTYEAMNMLGLAQVEAGDIMLTQLGMRYAGADQQERQEIFGRQLLAHVPLAARIREQLVQAEGGAVSEQPFIDLLEEHLEEDEAKRTLEIAVEWGRYGEVYEYDYHLGRLKLPEEEGA